MTLTAHAIVGASVAQLFPNHPVLAFSAGFVSHFLLDAVPHKDYRLASFKKNEHDRLKDSFAYDKKFIFDLVKIATDFSLGFIFVYLIYSFQIKTSLLVTTLAGATGAVLPDALQFVYFNFRHEPLTTLQKFHIKIQKKIGSTKWGIISQFVIVLIFVLVALSLN